MNIVWIIIVCISLVYGLWNGNGEEMAEAMLSSGQNTLEQLLKIGSLIIFYNGLFKVAIDSGLIKLISKFFSKFIKKIYKDLPENHIVNEYICANLVANLLGLGVASTPMAINALKEMKKLSNGKLSSSMIIFTVMNIASFTLFPLTILGIREIYHAKINMQLLPFLIIITFLMI